MAVNWIAATIAIRNEAGVIADRGWEGTAAEQVRRWEEINKYRMPAWWTDVESGTLTWMLEEELAR